MSDKLNEIFNVEPIEVVEPRVTNVQSIQVDEKVESDYEKTRNNLHFLLQQGKEALEHALEVAKVSEHPRAFEVVGGLMKHLSDINHQLLDLHTKRAKLEAKDGVKEQPTANITNNTVFVGSTTELSKMIENMRKDKA